jgi:hypothetical protein
MGIKPNDKMKLRERREKEADRIRNVIQNQQNERQKFAVDCESHSLLGRLSKPS